MSSHERLVQNMLEELPEHHPECLYECSEQDLWTDCDCTAKMYGKSFAHWQNKARELVLDSLLRASQLETASIIGYLAHKRIIDLAKKESPDLLQKILDERDRMRDNFSQILADL